MQIGASLSAFVVAAPMYQLMVSVGADQKVRATFWVLRDQSVRVPSWLSPSQYL